MDGVRRYVVVSFLLLLVLVASPPFPPSFLPVFPTDRQPSVPPPLSVQKGGGGEGYEVRTCTQRTTPRPVQSQERPSAFFPPPADSSSSIGGWNLAAVLSLLEVGEGEEKRGEYLILAH